MTEKHHQLPMPEPNNPVMETHRASDDVANRRRTKESIQALPTNEDGTIANEADRIQLIEDSAPLAEFVANKFFSRVVDKEDLRQEAYVALVEAVEKFDVTRDVELSTFAVPAVSNYLKKRLRDERKAVDGIQYDPVRAAAYDAAEQQLRVSGLEVTDENVAKVSGLSIDDALLERELRHKHRRPLSFDAPQYSDDESTLHETVADETPDYDELEIRMVIEQGIEKMSKDVYKEVLRLRFGLPPYERAHTQEEVAALFGCDRMQIYRYERQIAKELAPIL